MSANSINSTTNIGSSMVSRLGSTSLATCIVNEKPNRSFPVLLSALAGDSIGNINVRTSFGTGAQGSFSVSSPYSVSNQSSYDVTYFNRTDGGSLTATATATYPDYVAGWYSGNNGGGIQIVAGSTTTTSLSINLSSNMPLYGTVYAHFGDAHASITTYQSVSLATGSTNSQACNGSNNTYYTNGTAGTYLQRALFQNSTGTIHANAGWYSNSFDVGYYNGSGGWSQTGLCTF